MAHMYLEQIGVESDDPCVPNTEQVDEKRDGLFKEQRDTLGFDERETWSIDFTLAAWVYERFMWYLEKAPIDTTFYQVEATYAKMGDDGSYHQVRRTVSQKKAIKLVCKYMRYYLLHQDDDCVRANARYEAALVTMSQLMPLMWW